MKRLYIYLWFVDEVILGFRVGQSYTSRHIFPIPIFKAQIKVFATLFSRRFYVTSEQHSVDTKQTLVGIYRNDTMYKSGTSRRTKYLCLSCAGTAVSEQVVKHESQTHWVNIRIPWALENNQSLWLATSKVRWKFSRKLLRHLIFYKAGASFSSHVILAGYTRFVNKRNHVGLKHWKQIGETVSVCLMQMRLDIRHFSNGFLT